MSTYCKLFTSILDSTIWETPTPIRIVWITMLAMADRDGIVEASVPGLAKRAGVDRTQCEQALAMFLAPDPDSRTRAFEGRRIEELEGGWRLVNYEAYRDRMDADDRRKKDAERQRRKRERDGAMSRDSHVLSRDVTDVTDVTTSDQAQAQAQAQTRPDKTKRARGARPMCILPDDWEPNPIAVTRAGHLGLDPAATAEHFRDHHRSKASRFADWDAAFRTWLRNAVRFGTPGRIEPKSYSILKPGDDPDAPTLNPAFVALMRNDA